MENSFIFQLQGGSDKYVCPQCNKKSLVRYQNTLTMELLPINYGRCDREIKCSYHLKPNKLDNQNINPMQKINLEKKQDSKFYIPVDILFSLIQGKRSFFNDFLNNLKSNVPFPLKKSDVEEVSLLYFLGTIIKGEFKGSIAFPFIDIKKRIHAIQVKKFDANNSTVSTNFIHKMLEKHYIKNNTQFPNWLNDYNLNSKKVSCLFGEHLLNRFTNNPVALVEAPKSAIYGTLYFGIPQNQNDLVWLAVYNLSSLNYDKCKVLKGRDVYLFPDLSKDGSAFELWKNKAKELETKISGSRFIVSDFLEKNASENDRFSGLDIADFLIQQDWRKFRSLFTEKCENSEL
jgi:hypothetical protein